MSMINDMIRWLYEINFSETARTMCIAVAALAAVFFSLWYGKKIGLSKGKIFVFLLVAYPIDFLLLEMARIGSTHAATYHVLGIQTLVNAQLKTFVMISLVALLVAKIIKVPWRVTADLLATANLLNYAICSIGCLFTGCCFGYPWEYGLYSPPEQRTVFPIQIVNVIIMLLITWYLVRRTKKNGFVSDPKQFPLMLILFGATRFMTDFFMDNEKLLFGMSTIALHCIFMIFVGLIAILIIEKKNRIKRSPLCVEKN